MHKSQGFEELNVIPLYSASSRLFRLGPAPCPAPRVAPARNPPQPVHHAPPPAPAQQGGGGSLLGGIGSTIAQVSKAAAALAPTTSSMGGADACNIHSKAFQDTKNTLGKTVRDTIPASTSTWKDVKKEDLELILNRMKVKFDYPQTNAFFMDSIEQSMTAYLRDWRNQMQKHFTEKGGKRDMTFTKVNPYKHVPLDQWSIQCDRFNSDKFEGNPETEEPMSLIDYFESRHLKSIGWRNEYTQEKHACTQSDLGDDASFAESVVGLEQVDEFQIMSQALGTRSRWQKGVGALPQLKSAGGLRAASTRQVAETIATLK
ncbi:hypothetical protein PanWU01x14_133390 [Parasponia andersonii]|uniref:Transposase, Ptta/En/Spm, plant n=1 Tax=Parasponia andersonii TaxID=3476 RepID=A0A2P5CQD5_PARAD|nr:hypothetical protein PanWU01x14_133390 [Parasponia andersonii]